MKSWKRLLSYPFKEINSEPIKIIGGSLPKNLKGTLFRNSAVFLPRINEYEGHLFDGDGAVLRVTFRKDELPDASYRFVQNQKLFDEQKSKNNVYPSVGRISNSNLLGQLLQGRNHKNPGNQSVLPLKNGPLLALFEGDHPYILHQYSLTTYKTFDFDETLNKNEAFSSHPKICPKSDLIYNIGYVKGRYPKLNFFELNQSGKILRKKQMPLNGQRNFCHDFILAGKYLIVFAFPIMNQHFFQFILGRKSLLDCLAYKPELGTQLLVIDREKMEIVQNKLIETTFFTWHYSNGYVNEQGNVVFEATTYKNFDSFEGLSLNHLFKGNIKESLDGKLQRFELDIKNGKLLSSQTLVNDFCEFPTVNDLDVGQKWDVTYFTIGQRKDDLKNGLGRFSHGQYVKRFLPEGQYISEPLFIQNPEKSKDDGWLIALNYDGNQLNILLQLFDSKTLETICTMELPFQVAYSFHGRFFND